MPEIRFFSRIVVDANIFISALLGGKAGIILFDERLEFITTKYTIFEVLKYLPKLAEKTQLSVKEIEFYFAQLLALVNIFHNFDYKEYIKQSNELIGYIDEKDIEILALYLKEGDYLWSQDKHFKELDINLIKTEDFLCLNFQ